MSAISTEGSLQVDRFLKGTREVEPTQISLWDVYKFAYLTALRSLDWRQRTNLLRLILEPCNYWRNVEVPALINRLDVRCGHRILDIGSPKLASLFIWYRLGADVYATDLFDYFFEEYSHYFERLNGRGAGAAYRIERQDARRLHYPGGYFDEVYALSVLEHIEDDGDSQAMREVSRVLKPGGLCCITVPFSHRYRESVIDFETYYKKPVDGQPIFFERHYDPESLENRLVRPSGLRVLQIEYYGERWLPYERFYRWLPRPLKLLSLVFGPAPSRIFLYRLGQHRFAEAKTVLLLLRKETI